MSLLSSSELALNGVNAVVDAVCVTFGPKGREVTMGQPGNLKVPKRGVEIVHSITLKDESENVGANAIRTVATKTNEMVGDGTKTAVVLARSIYSESVKNAAAGSNPVDIRQGLQMASDRVIEFLSANAKVATSEDIFRVATISANGDAHVGNMISRALEEVGKEEVIIVKGCTDKDELEVAGGIHSIYGFLSPSFVTNQATQKVEFENPLILLSEKRLSVAKPILPAIEAAAKLSRPLLIMAEDVVEEAMATCVAKMAGGTVKVAAVKTPGFGEGRKLVLGDIATFTGSTVFAGGLEMATPDLLGSAGYVIISKDDTLIFNGAGPKEAVEARRTLIRSTLDNPSTCEDAKFMLRKRLDKLCNVVAAIKVGGSDELEISGKMDQYEHALKTTRSFVEEGILPGSGIALLKASELALGTVCAEHIPTSNSDQALGVAIVRKALTQPARTILMNAGEGAPEVVDMLLGQYGSVDEFAMGYDVNEGKYVDMYDAGIVDSLKVVRTALVEALSIASQTGEEKMSEDVGRECE